jgi:hypothetical protein
MQTIDHNTTTLARATETDNLDDLYVVVRRIPNNRGTLLHAYETETLIPLSQFIAKQKGKT